MMTGVVMVVHIYRSILVMGADVNRCGGECSGGRQVSGRVR